MYKNIYVEKDRGNKGAPLIHIWDDHTGYTRFRYPDYHYQLDDNGSFDTMDGHKAMRIPRGRYRNYGERIPDEIRYSDVNIDIKYLVDQYHNNENISKNYSVLFYDIETEITKGFPLPHLAENMVTSIAYNFYDGSEFGDYITLLLDPDNKIQETDKIKPFETEEELLIAWIDLFDDLEPDSIAGWNSHKFDDQYIINRCKNNLKEDYYLRMSPIRVINEDYKGKESEQPYTIEGVHSWDMIRLYKKFTYQVQDSYRLGYIGNLEVGLDKIEYEGNLTDLYNDDLEGFIKYNVRDVEILVELEKKKGLINLARMLSHLAHTPYKYVYFGSILEEGGVLTFLKQNNIIPINKPLIKSRPKFAGGYVNAFFIGRKKWVYDLDLTSLYPSIIRTLNLSPETKVGRILWDDTSDNLIQVLNNKGEMQDRIEMNDATNYKYYLDFGDGKLDDKLFKVKFGEVFLEEKFTGGALRELIKEEDYSLAANGVLFKNNIEGVIPKVLTSWFKKRVAINKRIKATDDKALANLLHTQQMGVKILLNTMFGALALKNFRFFDIELAEAITLTGQMIIKQSREIILRKSGIEVTEEDKYI